MRPGLVTPGIGTARSDLVAAATVGTAHRSVDLAALADPLRPSPLQADPAAALLDAAALSALARRTVLPTPPAASGAPILPVSEELPVVPNVVRQVLNRVVNQQAILLEALTLVGRAGFRLPPEVVPGLLDDTRDEVVAATRPVAGEIGRLLMTKNPRWAAPVALDPGDRTVWDEGTSAQRVVWLRARRRVDPIGMRDLLADSWSRETVNNRAEFLAVLADGLSGADEDFLLAAVEDRSRVVVEVAMKLLTRLPDSALSRDMRTLAARHLVFVRCLLRSTVKVTALLPQEFAPWPIPDSAPWIVLLGRIDPAKWRQAFDGDLLTLIASGDAELDPLQSGFREAAVTFRNAGLAQVLVTRMFSRVGPKAPPIVDSALWAVLSPADATEQLNRVLTHPLAKPDLVGTAVTALSLPWPAVLARRFADWLPTGGHNGAPAPRPLWDLWATAVPLPNCRELAELARSAMSDPTGDRSPALTTRISNAANLLTLRAVLYETLCVPGGNK